MSVDKDFFEIIKFQDLKDSEYSKDAITRNDFPGFYEDYLSIHCLIKKYKPSSIMEIGTSSGMGTNIICNAMEGRKVFSIDLPSDFPNELMYPNKEDGKPEVPGVHCKFPYTQLFGNSKDFDFSPYYPIDAWFIDGKHNYEYVTGDTKQALKSSPKLIIWHDMQIEEVHDGVKAVMSETNFSNYYIENTRIAFSSLERFEIPSQPKTYFNWDELMKNKNVEDFLASPDLWSENQGYNNPGRIAWRSYLKKRFTGARLRILEVGFGSAIDYKALAETGFLDNDQVEYYGVDVTEKFVEYAKEHFSKLNATLIDGYHIPFDDKYFDVIYLRHVLEHQAHYGPLLSEIFRVCRGEVFVNFFIELSDADSDDIRFDGTWYHNKYSLKLFCDFVKEKGFQFHNIAIFRKGDKIDNIIVCTQSVTENETRKEETLIEEYAPVTNDQPANILHIAENEFNLTPFNNVLHMNCNNRPLKNPQILDIATIAFNNSEVIAQQIRLLKKYLLDPHHYTVVDNSPDPLKKEQIMLLCENSGIAYIRLPENPYTGKDASLSHGVALNWVVRHFLRPRKANYFGFIDHDIFPVRSTTIIDCLQVANIYGLMQEKENIWYLWPGFCFFKREFVKRKKMNFMPDKGVDTGGGNWKSLYSKLDKSKIHILKHEYGRLREGDDPQADWFEHIGDWIHTFNASKWKKIKDKDSLVNKLLNKY